MAPPARYFDSPGGSRGSPRGAGRGGGSSRGGRGRGGATRAPPREDRPKKEPFKPKEGFIASGLKAYADAADGATVDRKAELSEGWKDKTTTQTTLYLSALPANLTSPQLSLIFSSYAPLRSAFVVSTGAPKSDAPAGVSSANLVPTGAGRDRTGKGSSRGFGYVRFVLKTDAEKCLEEWGTSSGIPRSALKELEGTEGLENVAWDKVCGRDGAKMSWAKKKLKEGEVAEKPAKVKKDKVAKVVDEAEADEEEKAPRWRPGVFDYNAARTVIVQGIPTEEEIAEAKAAKAAAKADKMQVDGDDKSDDEEDEEKKDDAEEEVKADGDDDDEAGESSGKAIDWKKALKQKAKKIGEIEDVQWPVVLPSGETVATILLYSPRSAHEVMKKLNNHVFRGIIVGACVKSSWDLTQRLGRAKGGGRLVVRNLGFDVSTADLRTVFAKYGSLHSIQFPKDSATGKPRGFAFIYFVVKSEAEKALKAVNGSRIYAGMADERIASEGGKEGKKKEVREKKKLAEKEGGGGGGDKGRVVAVDWALSKDDYKKAQEEEAEKQSASEGESDEASDDSDEQDDEDSDMSPNEDDDESEAAVSDSDPELDEEPAAPAESKGTTLFVRNISFEATEAELYDLFKEFGPVRYARIVYDPTTKRSRGTAFVCFWNDEDAEKVLFESESLNAGLFGETSDKKKSSQPQSLLMADASTSKASKLTLHGRVLAAVAAVSKDDADKFREDRDKKGAAKADRRNLYLMREGVIFPTWAIAQTLHASDLAARQSSFDARKSLLRSNPSLYISRTRLSVRQIPLYASDGMMKRLANHALRAFDKEVTAGHQKALTEDELNNKVVDAAGAPAPEGKTERVKGIPLSRVRQAKILRQSDRIDPLTGMGRSKGYGFLELASHADALRVLRWANANKDVGALFRMWWRESLEKMIVQVETGEGLVGKKAKLNSKEKEERLKRLREKMAELEEEEEIARGKAARAEAKGKVVGEGGRSQKCLIVEFSIENATVTKRRADKVARSREKAKRFKDREAEQESESGADSVGKKSTNKKRKAGGDGTPGKKPKLQGEAEQAAQEAGEGSRKGLSVGAIIGRKRAKGKR